MDSNKSEIEKFIEKEMEVIEKDRKILDVTFVDMESIKEYLASNEYNDPKIRLMMDEDSKHLSNTELNNSEKEEKIFIKTRK